MAKVHIKIKTDKRNCRKLINHRLLFLFQWKYMRETHFYVVCTSVTRGESRGGECSPPLPSCLAFTDVHDIEMDFLSYISIEIEIISDD